MYKFYAWLIVKHVVCDDSSDWLNVNYMVCDTSSDWPIVKHNHDL